MQDDETNEEGPSEHRSETHMPDCEAKMPRRRETRIVRYEE